VVFVLTMAWSRITSSQPQKFHKYLTLSLLLTSGTHLVDLAHACKVAQSFRNATGLLY